MTEHEAIQLLVQWLREVQTDLATAHRRIRELEHDLLKTRRQTQDKDKQMNYMRDWMQGRTPDQILELAADLAEVA